MRRSAPTPGFMISVRIGAHQFHVRSAAIIVEDGYLLLHRSDGDSYWALPGGRVNAGESAREALQREFMEELGLPVDCKRLVCTGENFFEHDGLPHHEICLYFEAQLPAPWSLTAKSMPYKGVEEGRELEFRWFLVRELGTMDFRPKRLRDALASKELPLHFIERGPRHEA